MGRCEVCFEVFTRDTHVPRELFCRHTFCTPCLNSISKKTEHCSQYLETIKCPMCRSVSCLLGGIPLEEALWVSECLSDDKASEDEERSRAAAKEESKMQLQCSSNSSDQSNSFKLRMRGILKKFSAPRHLQKIARRCNVTGK